MKFNFNERIDRSKNHAAKWEEMGKRFGSNDLLPMWIADMDIKTAPEIVEAIKEKADQCIFGYVYRPDEYYRCAAKWIKKRFGYIVDSKTLIHSPGVVPSMNILVKELTKPDEKILIQTPVYPPFADAVKYGNRKLVINELIKDEKGYYTIDFEDMEKKLSDEKVTLFILCSPHNPVGRVWTRSELKKIGELCLKYNVRILADEIWRDLVLPGHIHTPMASISSEIEDITITCFSPTKTFNIAGLQASFVTFPRKEELARFDEILGEMDIRRNNPFSLVGFEAAYKYGEDWLSQLLVHLDGNAQYVVDYIGENIPEIKVVKPEGTYLMWLDFNSLGVTPQGLQKMLVEDAKIAMNDGSGFGENGKGFARLNIACPRYMIEDAMQRIKHGVEEYKRKNMVK